jgi:hypothetical protein
MRDYETEMDVAEYAKALADNAREQGTVRGLVWGLFIGAAALTGVQWLLGVL